MSTPAQSQSSAEFLRKLQAEADLLTRGSDGVGLFDDPFALVLELSPSLGGSEEEAAEARATFELLARHASAKEVALALSERLTNPRSEEPLAAAKEIAGLASVYAKALPRIRAKRPIAFVDTAVHSIASAIAAWSAEQVSPSHEVASLLLKSVSAFVDELAPSAWLAESDASSTFARLLCHVAAALHPFLQSGWTNEIFMQHNPRYRRPNPPCSPEVKDAWAAAVASCDRIGLSYEELYNLASSISTGTQVNAETEEKETSIVHSIGAFALLVAALAATNSPKWSIPPPSRGVRETLPLIVLATAGEGHQSQVSADIALFWLWRLVLSGTDAREKIEDGLLFTLVQLLTPLAALSPSEQTRFLSFRLIATLILDMSESEESQLILLRDLLGPECPFEGMRAAAVGLTREVLAAKFDKGGQSLLLSPFFLVEVGPSLLKAELSDKAELEKFVERHLKKALDQLSVYYFVLVRDSTNQTGVRSPDAVARTDAELIKPLKSSLSRLTSSNSSADGAEVALALSQLGILNDSLERVDGALGDIASQ